MSKVMVMVPTYNEAENVPVLIKKLFALPIQNLEVVIVDDHSPDETWKIVQTLMQKYPTLHLLHRTYDKGRGRAGIAGFQFCLDHNADIIIEMDADLQHDPQYIPQLISGLSDADMVLGSRRAKGGSDAERPLWRRTVTYGANLYIRLLTGMRVRDCNSGFRAFKAKVLRDVNLQSFTSKGPSIVQELLYTAHLKGFTIREVPIIFYERKVGDSKLTWKEMYQGYKFITLFKLRQLLS